MSRKRSLCSSSASSSASEVESESKRSLSSLSKSEYGTSRGGQLVSLANSAAKTSIFPTPSGLRNLHRARWSVGEPLRKHQGIRTSSQSPLARSKFCSTSLLSRRSGRSLFRSIQP
ncbi:hypothetical protein BJX66DRAFT_310331 [Aspergillus keveii]|uniref:Uncharacterized protein n=1 Tax=Aspergillus keveii TaxID=714993 RepID=A0ABR4FWL6_9EURO